MKKVLVGMIMLAFCESALAKPICTIVNDKFGPSKQYRPGQYDETFISGEKPWAQLRDLLVEQPYPNLGTSPNFIEAFFAVDPRDRDNYLHFLTDWSSHDLTMCIDTRKVLFLGDNTAGREPIGYASQNYENDDSVRFTTTLRFNGQDRKICDLYYGRKTLVQNASCADFWFTARLSDLDPGLYRELRTARAELNALMEEGIEVDEELAREIESLDEALDNVHDKIFAQFDESDFAEIRSLLSAYESLKLDINAAYAESARLKQDFDSLYSQASEDINHFVASEGISIGSFSDVPEMELSGLDINLPSLSQSSSYSSQLYRDYADATLDKLRDLYAGNDNKEFIRHTKLWIDTTGEIKKSMDLLITASPDEWRSMISSFERVENYVFSVIDNDFWFRDSPVTLAQREAVDSIRDVSPKWAGIIDNELRTYRANNNTPDRQNILTALESLGRAIDEEGAENINPAELEETFAGMAEAIKTGAVCAAKIIALSDFGDFYEIVIGKDLCTGESLSVGERMVSVVGVAFGSARFWRGAAKASGIISETKHFINVSSKLKEVAASFGMTKAQLENLAKKMAQYYPCD